MDNPFRNYGISDHTYEWSVQVMREIAPAWERIDAIREKNQLKVLKAFWNARISDTDFGIPTGYGYDDIGREKIERMYAELFGGESAYVRIQISAGTQAIAMGLFGILRPGDELLSITGRPYDTLMHTIGIGEEMKEADMGSLSDFGVKYKEVSLLEDSTFDLPAIRSAITDKTKIVFIQKSKGYTARRCLLNDDLKNVIDTIHGIRANLIVFVDNCYGEFVEELEPCSLGADLCAGSLIKNPGAGLCPAGGYLVGRTDLIEKIASRATAPGLGSHIGPSLGFNRTIAQGLFMAPHIVAECVKGAVFSAALFEKAGFSSHPGPFDPRGDIVQSIRFDSGEQVVDFCRIIQASSPVDSFVQPEPWEMPGYDSPVVMAAGTFIQGASVELSADGPIKPPFIAYMQGGLVFEQTKLAAMRAVEKMGVVPK